jgi:ABC-2 type transport system permease protein
VTDGLRVLQVEYHKTFAKLRTYIGFAALGVAVPVLLIAFRLSHIERSSEFGRLPDISGFTMVGSPVNGLFLVRVILVSLFVHVPFLISLVAGDQIAGEASAGTLRLICVRPPSRLTIITAKFLVSLLYCLWLVLFLGAVATGVGVLLFGHGPLLLSGPGIAFAPELEGYERIVLALLLGAAAMAAVSSVAFLFSVLVTNPIGPIIGTMAVLIVFLIVSSTPLHAFDSIRPYLFTTYMPVWTYAFDRTVNWGVIGRQLSVLAGYTLGLYALAAGIFLRKDIVT